MSVFNNLTTLIAVAAAVAFNEPPLVPCGGRFSLSGVWGTTAPGEGPP